jgi:asparagine synthase (glutamine-hydrolysing)
MCGVAGAVALGNDDTLKTRVLQRMMAALTHRGPDSDGIHHEPGVGLTCCRLAIVGLRRGEQPVASEDSSVIAVCNGEIFNHQRLRAELTACGHRISGDSDVAILPHLYEEHQEHLVARLNGQFAFAIWDRPRRRLVLARDPFGIAPMFYTTTIGPTLVFGSEVKALLEHPDVPREVDPTGLDQVLTLPGLVSPTTMFRGVSALPPGHLLIAEGGRIEVKRYWDLVYPRADDPRGQTPDDEHVDRLRCALRRAIDLRMRADVDHAHYLSGGLDSALIASMAAELAPDRRPRTFSVVLRDPRLSERRWQRLVAGAIHAEHTEVEVGPVDLVARLPDVIRHCECPVRESYNVASFMLSRAVHDAGLKVVLTGEGSDELFAGYVGYRFDRAVARVARDGPLTQEQQLRQRLFGNPHLAYQGDLLGLRKTRRRLYAKGLAERLTEFDAMQDPLVDLDQVLGRDVLHQRSYLDVKLRLADHLLGDHGDRMALAHAVEVRYPFLDPDVVACAVAAPPDLKLRDFHEKYIVKRVADGVVPEPIVRREKFAFAADASPALLREHGDIVRQYLDPVRLRRDGYFDPEAVAALLNDQVGRDEPLDLIFENDLLMVVVTFGMFLDVFGLR